MTRVRRLRTFQSLFGWIGPKTLVQPHEWTAFLLRRVAVHIYHLTTANLLKSRTPIITGVTPIIACLTSETQQNRLLDTVPQPRRARWNRPVFVTYSVAWRLGDRLRETGEPGSASKANQPFYTIAPLHLSELLGCGEWKASVP